MKKRRSIEYWRGADWSTRYGEELRRMRMEAGVTQIALARAIGVDQATLSRWECGRYRAPKMAVLAARYLLEHGMQVEV